MTFLLSNENAVWLIASSFVNTFKFPWGWMVVWWSHNVLYVAPSSGQIFNITSSLLPDQKTKHIQLYTKMVNKVNIIPANHQPVSICHFEHVEVHTFSQMSHKPNPKHSMDIEILFSLPITNRMARMNWAVNGWFKIVWFSNQVQQFDSHELLCEEHVETNLVSYFQVHLSAKSFYRYRYTIHGVDLPTLVCISNSWSCHKIKKGTRDSCACVFVTLSGTFCFIDWKKHCMYETSWTHMEGVRAVGWHTKCRTVIPELSGPIGFSQQPTEKIHSVHGTVTKGHQEDLLWLRLEKHHCSFQ